MNLLLWIRLLIFILKEYLLKSAQEEELSNYTNSIIYNNTIYSNNLAKSKGLTNKVRRITTLIKYTQENQQLFKEAFNKYKKKGKIPINYNIKCISLDNTTC